MRRIVITLVMLSCSALHSVTVAQTRPGASPLKPCLLLTPELVKKVSAGTQQAVDAAGPKEVPLGASRSACEWGNVMLQLDPFTPARLEEMRKTTGKNWEPVSGVGDSGYFHNVKDVAAELFVSVGGHTFVVVMDIPAGSTASAFKPNFIAVAKEIGPKLR